jgi:phosphoribosylformylglycinamidine synthase
MNFAVIQFPVPTATRIVSPAINGLEGLQAEYVWHKETSLDDFDAIILPGGFAYGIIFAVEPSLVFRRS